MKLIKIVCCSMLFTLAWTILSLPVRVAYAHTGENIFLIYEITDDAIKQINFSDGTLSDWPIVLGPPSTTLTDFLDTSIFDGVHQSSDIDFQIWLGWNHTHSRLYVAVERLDNVHLNNYTGEDDDQIWFYDSFEFMIDGDHSGGEYGFLPECCDTEEAWMRIQNTQAQQYFILAESADKQLLENRSAGPWPHQPPYAAAGSTLLSGSPNKIYTEFYVTPFDSLVWDQAEASKKSILSANKIVGFNISVPDFDRAPKEYTHYYTLSQEPSTWRTADRFVDGLLIRNTKTSIENTTWARIKAAFNN